MKIYNSLSRKIEVMETIIPGKVSIYLCGPTVYDEPHAGHGRSAVSFDALRKFLQYEGFEVRFVSNYTDIDDKMIKRAAEQGITVPELAEKIIPIYQEYYQKLSVKPADITPKATDYIEKMIVMIEKLLEQKKAYLIEGDGVYFSIDQYADYGVLTSQNLADLRAGARIAVKDLKKNSHDFVLWKFKKEGEPSWQASFGEGRPGWHIECSAMIEEIFAAQAIDIHAGGEDLKFPHHECEIAQTKSACGHRLANYWMHNGFVMVNSEKMSKSLNNFTTLSQLLNKYKPEVVRYYYLQVHYRKPLDFHDLAMEQAENALLKIRNCYQALLELQKKNTETTSDPLLVNLEHLSQSFTDNLGNDLDIEAFLVDLHAAVKTWNKAVAEGNLSSTEAGLAVEFLAKIDQVLGFIVPMEVQGQTAKIKELIAKRNEARKNRDFALADSIREQLLKDFDVQILDKSPTETTWRQN